MSHIFFIYGIMGLWDYGIMGLWDNAIIGLFLFTGHRIYNIFFKFISKFFTFFMFLEVDVVQY